MLDIGGNTFHDSRQMSNKQSSTNPG